MSDVKKIIAAAEQLSDKELRAVSLKLIKKVMGYPHDDFLPTMDTSREGLLDLIAGLTGMATEQVILTEIAVPDNPSSEKN
jgi:hypothetical protein